jgi:hypothetical protein
MGTITPSNVMSLPWWLVVTGAILALAIGLGEWYKRIKAKVGKRVVGAIILALGGVGIWTLWLDVEYVKDVGTPNDRTLMWVVLGAGVLVTVVVERWRKQWAVTPACITFVLYLGVYPLSLAMA